MWESWLWVYISPRTGPVMTQINWNVVQQRLAAHGLYPGKMDGIGGPQSWIGLVDFAAPSQPNGSDLVTLRGRKLADSAALYGLTSAERISGFLSQTTHETGDYRVLRENLYYKTPAQIRAVWPSRFLTDASALPFIRNPEALANKVYARPNEGNTDPGDGFKFRGGGDFQTTFKNGYALLAQATGLPLVEHPELIETPQVAVLAGLFYFQSAGIGKYYDAGQPKQARSLANAGRPDIADPIGWDDGQPSDVKPRYERLMELLL